MQQQPRRGEPEIDLEQIFNRIGDFLRSIGGRFGGRGVGDRGGDRAIALIALAILGLSLVLWLATGIYTVGAGEKGVLRTFGKVTGTTAPGLHWHWPAPIGTRNVEDVEKIRSMELGFSVRGGITRAVNDEARMIAGDLNVVDVPLVVQYQIRDPVAFLFNVADPGEGAPNRSEDIALGRPEGRTLKDATEAALRLVVGQRSIDDVLTTKKAEVQANTKELLQQILDSYGTGIQVTRVDLQDVKPPDEVRPAFSEVLRARQEKETVQNEATAFEREIVPRAEGEAEKILRDAEADRERRVAEAEGEAGRFLAILGQYKKARDVTRQRLYLEAMEEILPGITKFIVSPGAEGTIILNAGGGDQVVPIPGLSPGPEPTVGP